ncbi:MULTISPECIES: hypothetical protein [Pseudomonas]|uniref:hypothetical protein n=1 Tax=Pseudomonas TaxID=286 RepID=UPI000C2AD9E1|nr:MULTISPECIES: hypothetical protein [Pseudomonas]PJY96980.1 hypothetical protein COO64_09130 [Pseudomonas donghuensis]WKY30329.1 hypothetical protein QYF67_10185 [Pseudomonas donghuensis]
MPPLDDLRAQMIAAEESLKKLDIEMEKIEYDPLIPESVQEARKRVRQLIDTILADFGDNPVLAPMVAELRSLYLDRIEEHLRTVQGRESGSY